MAENDYRREVRDAERRARRKLRRLEGRGINAQAVSPIRQVDLSNPAAAREYRDELERFVSRRTRYVRGRDGKALPYEEFRNFQRAERAWNRVHDRMWGYFANHPYVSAGRASDATVSQVSMMGRNVFMRGASARSQVSPERFGSVGEMRRLRKTLESQSSPAYWTYRMERLRYDLRRFSRMFPPEVEKALDGLSNQQLFMLMMTTDFVEMYFSQIDTNGEGELSEGKRESSIRIAGASQHLMASIDAIRRSDRPKGLRYYVRNDSGVLAGTEYEAKLAEARKSARDFRRETKRNLDLRKTYGEDGR